MAETEKAQFCPSQIARAGVCVTILGKPCTVSVIAKLVSAGGAAPVTIQRKFAPFSNKGMEVMVSAESLLPEKGSVSTVLSHCPPTNCCHWYPVALVAARGMLTVFPSQMIMEDGSIMMVGTGNAHPLKVHASGN